MEMLNEPIENHCQLVIVDSWPMFMNIRSDGKLMKNAVLTAFLQYRGNWLVLFGKMRL